MEPPPLRPKTPVAALPPVQVSERVRDGLEELFPEDSWVRDATKVKVIEMGQATLLIQDYITTQDGDLELRPCTIIFYAAGGPAPGSSDGKRPRRPIVLEAPQGATLAFEHPFDMTRSQWGRVRKGTLAGPITIRSPASQPGSRDELFLTTRDIRLDRDLVMTPHEVDFRYGDSHGRGSNLTITLLNNSDDKSKPRGKSAFGGVQLLKLNKLEFLHIVGGGSALGESQRQKGTASQAGSSPLEVTCRGPFSFDMVRQSARFDERVQVLRTLPDAPPDRLNCETLVLDFGEHSPADRPKDSAGQHSVTKASLGPADGNPLANRLKRLLAIGNPAVMESPTRAMKGIAASIEYSPEDRRLTLMSPAQPGENTTTPVTLHQAGQHFVASQLQYEGAAEGQMGKLWAAGPGELRMVQGQGLGDQPVVAHWEKELRVRPHEQFQLISLQGAASVNIES